MNGRGKQQEEALPLVTVLVDPDHALVECVEPDGSTSLWWLYRDGDYANVPCSCPGCVPHEQEGPLPRAIRRRLHPPTCRATTRAGRRCRRRVHAEGEVCHQHRAAL